MTTNLVFIALAFVVALIVICFILNMVNSSKINTLLEYGDGGDIIGALKEYYNKVDLLEKNVKDRADEALLARLANCEGAASSSIKKLGVVNFDAYEDVTGKLSFSVALLDSYDNGIILTSLYGHNSCNTYIREIRGGKAQIKLLSEENQALTKAKNIIKEG